MEHLKCQVSVVINTLNEERNIKNAIDSVKTWADEVIVVDMYSDDATVKIAKSLGAKIFMHQRLQNFEIARKFAISCAHHQWILILDADEQIPVYLSHQIKSLVKENNYDVVIIPRLNYMFGLPITSSGWDPETDSQIRLFKKNCVKITCKIHDYIKIIEGCHTLRMKFDGKNCIIHYNYIDLLHHFTKINTYTTIEAHQALESGKHTHILKMFYDCIKEFLKRYIIYHGYRDGWLGFQLALNMAIYKMLVCAKMMELDRIGQHIQVEDVYSNQAKRIIADYEK
jgi:glycosyltransferase involved in cell wall biosynthesis